MAKGRKNFHVGGEQLALISPPSDWTPPTELPDLRRCGRIAVDAENRDDGIASGRGSGWPYMAGHLIGVAAAWPGGKIYVPTRHPDTVNFDEDQVKRWLADHFKAKNLRVVMHHASHDVGWLNAEWGVPPPAQIDDTECMAVMVDENRLDYKLDNLCHWRGLPGKNEELLRHAAACLGYDPKSEMYKIPARYVGAYAEDDAAQTLDLADDLDKVIDAEGTRAAYQLEMDIVPMVHEMRRRGVRVDLDEGERVHALLEKRRDDALRELSEHVGREVGMDEIRSQQWLVVAHQNAKISFPRTAKTGQGSFTKDWMRGHKHPLPRLVSLADKLDEAANKFVRGFIMDYAHRGRLHSSVNQYRGEDGGTRSHRFSYSDPPLQQMPKRDEEMATLIRGLLLPEEGEEWESNDYSQQEYRLIVHYATKMGLSRAEEAAEKYRRDPKTDFHMLVAELTGLERKPAKDTNFAKAFGAGVPKFAAMTGKTLKEAAEIMQQYDTEMPFVKELGQRCQKLANQRGYIKMLDGARSHFEMYEVAWREEGELYQGPRPLHLARETWPNRRLKRAFVHKAMNRLIQGSAARQTKMAMRECWRQGLVPLLQMHDELCFSHPRRARVGQVASIMRDVVTLEIPVAVDTKRGRSWGAVKD